MRLFKIAGIAVTALTTVTASALAQEPTSQTPTTQTTQTQTKSEDQAQAAVRTYTGCLMTEPAYRRAHNLGSGAVGGMGLGDEFVLTDVTVSTAKEGAAVSEPSSSSAVSSSSTATSTCADKGVAYRLTGTAEEKIKGLVGHQLEVQGRLKHADDVTAAGTPESGKLPAEVEIVSFRDVPSPTAMTTEPTPPQPPTPPVTPPQRQVEPPTTPPPATSTVEPSRTTPTTTQPRELPHTASPMGVLLLVGALALASGLVLNVWRRRAF